MEYNTVVLKKYNQLFNHPLNGTYFTETAGSVYKDLLFVTSFISEATHKYFLAMPNNDNLYTAVNIGGYREMSTTSAVSPTKLITEAQAGYTSNYIYVRLKPGKSITNSQVWFSIVDLTRLYGIGNEPTTVSQFLSDYPQFNEYVEYKENGCFEKKYDMLVGKMSKNLFDISKVKTRDGRLINNEDGSITIAAGQYSVEAGIIDGRNPKLKDYCPSLKVGDNAVLSMNTSGQPFIVLFDGSDYITWNINTSKSFSQTLLDSRVFFYNSSTHLVPATISDIMIELGSTATEYEPYGWIEKEYNALTLKKYNQLATETPFDNGSGNRNYTLSYNSNTNLHTIEATASQTGARVLCTKRIQARQNHKYAIILNFLENSFSKKTGVHLWLYLGGVGYTISYDYSAILQWNYQDSNILMMLDLITNSPDSFTAGQKAVFYLNIVDLTEMYGAGNEPTTVQKFLEDNPEYNDYVPYSEGGWM